MSILNKKYTLKEIFSFSEGGGIANSKKHITFTPFNPTKDEINQIISGKKPVSSGDFIQAAARHLRGGKGASKESARQNSAERSDQKELREYISKNNLWISRPAAQNKIASGGEAIVYFYDDHVIKMNYARSYSSWLDYFNSLLIHNYLFQETAYELMGFLEAVDSGKKELYAVVKQNFIKESRDSNLLEIRKELLDLGFVPAGGKNYNHPKLGIELKDIHEGNVLVEGDSLYFIDTIFFLK